MNYKVSTFKFSIENGKGEEEFLANLPTNIDFQQLCDEFCIDILSNTKKFSENGKNKSLTLREPHRINNNERYICGKFDAGSTGDPVDINDPETNETNYSVSPIELQARIHNFYFSIPKNKRFGFLILQRKSIHSIKKCIEDCFNSFLVRKGFVGESKLKFKLTPAPNFKLMNRMMEQGELKEVNLQRKIIGNNFTEIFEESGSSNFGSTTIQLKFEKNAVKEVFKQVLSTIYVKNYTGDDQIEIEGNLFDEVAFTFYLDKITKTFYVKDKAKIRSEIDISSMVDIQEFIGEIPMDQYIEISKRLILEIS